MNVRLRIELTGESETNRPPWVRMMGLPVRVMVTSERARRCRALFAIFGADRTVVGKEAIAAGRGSQQERRPSQLALAMARAVSSVVSKSTMLQSSGPLAGCQCAISPG